MEIKEKSSKEYKLLATKITEQLINKLANRLKAAIVIGSSSSDYIITNWSDIDFIIVVDEINSKVIETIKSVVNNNDIKIGCTVYSNNDVTKMLLDSKSHYYFFLLQNGIINYSYKSDDFKINKIKKNDLHVVIYNILLNNMHICKRNLLYDEWDISICKSQFKIIYASMKCMLTLNNVYTLNYKDTFDNYNSLFKFEKLDYLKIIKEIKNNHVDTAYLKKYSLDFINNVTEILEKR